MDATKVSVENAKRDIRISIHAVIAGALVALALICALLKLAGSLGGSAPVRERIPLRAA